VQARDARLLATGWRVVILSSAVGGGAGTMTFLTAVSGTVPWWGVLGWALASVTGFFAARKIVAQNVKLMRMLDDELLSPPPGTAPRSPYRNPTRPNKNAPDDEDDE